MPAVGAGLFEPRKTRKGPKDMKKKRKHLRCLNLRAFRPFSFSRIQTASRLQGYYRLLPPPPRPCKPALWPLNPLPEDLPL